MSEQPETENTLATRSPKRPSWDLNNIATIGAVILSIIAISISVLEVSTMRTQQRAAVWPYLQINTTYSADGFKVLLENKGVGPALIQDMSILIDGKPLPTSNFDNIVEELVGREDAFSYDVYQVFNPNKSVVSPQEKIRLFSVPLRNVGTNKGDFVPGIRFAEQAGKRLNMNICYCSIHKDCWITDIKTAGVEDIKSCN